jgi:hypothetical protein
MTQKAKQQINDKGVELNLLAWEIDISNAIGVFFLYIYLDTARNSDVFVRAREHQRSQIYFIGHMYNIRRNKPSFAPGNCSCIT